MSLLNHVFLVRDCLLIVFSTVTNGIVVDSLHESCEEGAVLVLDSCSTRVTTCATGSLPSSGACVTVISSAYALVWDVM